MRHAIVFTALFWSVSISFADSILVAHRGLLTHAPENTLAAYSACLDLRLGFELDVQRSKDGTLVVIHDATLQRTTNGKGAVKDFTLAELKKLDAGAWFHPAFAEQRILTLDETFALVKQRGDTRSLIAVDIKIADDKVEADIVRLAKKHGILQRIVCIGTTISSAEVRKRLHAADSSTPVARLAQVEKDLDEVLADRSIQWAYLRFIPTVVQVTKAHKLGKKVIVVGVTVAGKEPRNWQKVREAGADAMLTDHPLECRQSWRAAKR